MRSRLPPPQRYSICTLRPAPSPIVKCLHKCFDVTLRFRIVFGHCHQHADAPHPLALLRLRRERPRAAAPPSSVMNSRRSHSITSSARASSVDGTSRSSNLAVCVLMTSSNLIDCMTGKSAGLAPLRTRPVYAPIWR